MTAFDPKSLLGQAESDHLEFKEAEALRRPANIAREVVGFLNANGGSVWVGVKEESGRAVELQEIPDVERSLGALRDYLIDMIEPQFSSEEVKLANEGGLLRVTVQKGHNPPYAQRDGGRRFMVRIADRLREMSREEIARAFNPGLTKEELAKIVDEVRRTQQSEARNKSQFWIRLVPTESLEIDFHDEPTKRQFETWLTDPSTTKNRRSGWDFANDQRWPHFRGAHVEQGAVTDYMRTRITASGQVTFAVDVHALSRLELPTPHFEPYALIEYPVSVFRLMAEILRRFDKGHGSLKVVAGLSISGIRGWSLMPGSPREPVRSSGGPKVLENDQDVLELDPEQLVFEAAKVKESPDQGGLRVVRYIYEKFDFGDDAIPREFDQKQGVLLLE